MESIDTLIGKRHKRPSTPGENPNRLLASLSPQSRDQLLDSAVLLDLPLRTSLYSSEQRPQFAYFITSGLASVVATTEDGGTAEIGIVSREGVIGALHIIGPAPIGSCCYMQIEGSAWRIPLADLRKAYLQSDEVRYRLLEFIQEQALFVGQVAGCNRLHEAEARLARWLLMAQDRTGNDALHLTQEFLGMMLGARRTTVSLIAGNLQRLGYIESTRGRVVILDRDRLKNVACDCYRVTAELLCGLYSGVVGEW